MVETNGTLTENLIEKKWNLENWNDKSQNYKTEMKNSKT